MAKTKNVKKNVKYEILTPEQKAKNKEKHSAFQASVEKKESDILKAKPKKIKTDKNKSEKVKTEKTPVKKEKAKKKTTEKPVVVSKKEEPVVSVKPEVIIEEKPEIVKEEVVLEHKVEDKVETKLPEKPIVEEKKEVQENTSKIHTIVEAEKIGELSALETMNQFFDTTESTKRTFIRNIFQPLWWLDTAKWNENNTTLTNILKILFRHGVVWAVFAYYISGILNMHPFSYARMTFTDSSYLWLRLTIFGFVTQVLVGLIKVLLANVLGRKASFIDYLYYEAEITLPTCFIFLISFVVSYFNMVFGCIFLFASVCFLFFLHIYAFKQQRVLNMNAVLWLSMLGVVIGGISSIYIFRIAGQDIIMILQALFNLK